MRNEFYIFTIITIVGLGILGFYWHPASYILVGLTPFILIGLKDALQNKKTVLKNFPILGHGRYMLEAIRPELQQYFVESNLDGRPINREQRSIVYQRAKGELQTLPFGTQRDVYSENYEWVEHSMYPTHVDPSDLRVTIGNSACKQPYSCSIFNISAMSYGSLSKNAVLSLNGGAKKGNFYQNTGEGAISPYHLKHGGDLVWQIGTGYFGCRSEDGNFCPDKFKENASRPEVKMIELKISQGAKPAHGGILPGKKVTEEIAQIRGVPVGKDVLSPSQHKAFSGAKGLIGFLKTLRDLSDGKPIGFKLCIGSKDEFFELCKEMILQDIYPDFITVDGSEGGTGAAPLEFSNSVGSPLKEGLSFVHNALVGFDIRQHIKIIAAGKVITSFHLLKTLAMGADVINSARAMMLAIGCIHALRCNTNKCPVGVATSDPMLNKGLVVENKIPRVYHYHKDTVKHLAELLSAMGKNNTQELERKHIFRRVSQEQITTYEGLYPSVKQGVFLRHLQDEIHQGLRKKDVLTDD